MYCFQSFLSFETKYERIVKHSFISRRQCCVAHRCWTLSMIPPTVSEVASALAGGTVGVMGTLLVLEVLRQRVGNIKRKASILNNVFI